MKRAVKLTERELKHMISESVKKSIFEAYGRTKEQYRTSYTMDEFSKYNETIEKNLSEILWCIEKLSDSQTAEHGKILKQYGFKKSQQKLDAMRKYCQESIRLNRLIKEDVSGEYKDWESGKIYRGSALPKSEWTGSAEMH